MTFTLLGFCRQVYRRLFGYHCPVGWCGGRVRRGGSDYFNTVLMYWWGCKNCDFGYWGRK